MCRYAQHICSGEHPLAADARRLRQRTPAAATATSLLQKKRRSKLEPPDP
jgi:hypothetical protein